MTSRRATVVLLALAPGAALAHGGEAHHRLEAAEVARWWTWDPVLWAALLLALALYARGLATLWCHASAGRGLRRWQAGAFLAGWLTTVVALLSPVDRLSDLFFSAHMAQHELLMVVAAPLMVLGRPLLAYLWALPDGARARVGRLVGTPPVRATWRWATGPLVVLLAHAAARWAWHLPGLHEAALRSGPVHAVQHFTFFATATLFWWALVNGRYGRLGYGMAVGFVFLTAMHTGALGALLTFARTLWYPLYAQRAEGLGVEPLEDQQLAGLLMWVPSGTLFLVIALALFAAWLGAAERQAAHGTRPGSAQEGTS